MTDKSIPQRNVLTDAPIPVWPVKSSAIQAAGFSAHNGGTMRIRFQSGKEYDYSVSMETYLDFLGAKSKGKFFNEHIKGTIASGREVEGE